VRHLPEKLNKVESATQFPNEMDYQKTDLNVGDGLVVFHGTESLPSIGFALQLLAVETWMHGGGGGGGAGRFRGQIDGH
jgi:hypothetical protein